MFLNTKIYSRFGFVLVFFLSGFNAISAQEELVVAEVQKETAWRIGFWEVLHQTFSDDESHPFYQMTGTNRFRAGKGFFGTTFIDIDGGNILPNVYEKHQDGHDVKDGFITNILNKVPIIKGIPTFSLEYILSTDYFVGIGLSFAYTNIWLNDENARAATSGGDPSYATPLLRMASHFFMFSAAIHPFGVPKTDEMDIFIGFGLARVETTLRYGIRANPNISDYASITKTEFAGSTGTVPFRRMGIATGGESFGFMLEFLFTGKNEIIENPFSSNTIIDSSIYDVTYNDRGGVLPSKVGIPGGISRFSWTYSF